MSETAASRITTVSRVYLIIALFIALIFCLVLLVEIQMNALIAVRAYVGGEGLWAKAQKDAVRSLEHYAISRDEADYQLYRQLIQVPLGDRKARLELQKPNSNPDIAREGFLQGRNHPVDIEHMITFFRRFQHIAYMSQAIGHWTAGDQLIAELNDVAEKLHDETALGLGKPEDVRTIFTRLATINRQVTAEEDSFSATLADASRWANDVSRNLTYAIAFLFAVLGVTLSWPIITRIRITENTLFENEERLRNIFEHVNDIIFAIESDGTFSFISPSSERLIGWSPDELIHQPFTLLVQPEDLPYMQELLMKARAGEHLPTFQVRILTKAGGYLESEIVANPVHRGGSITILGVVRDITERMQAHAEIKFKNTILQTQQEISLDAILVVDGNGQIISYNQQFIDLWRISPQVIGTHLDAPVLQSVLDQIENAEAFAARVQYLYEHRDDKSREEIRLKDGRIIDRYSAPATGADGKYYGRVWYFRDITERKHTEKTMWEKTQLLDNIVDNIPNMVFLKRASDLRFELFNRAGEELVGHSRDELIGRNDYDFFPTAQADFFTGKDRAVLEQNSIVDIPEEPIATPHGTRILHTKKLTLRDKQGQPQYLLGISEDITERKQAEANLRIAATAFESQESLMITDANSVILQVNQAFTKTTGYTAEEAVGQTPRLFKSGHHDAAFYAAMWEAIQRTGTWQGEIWDRRKNGDVYPKLLTISAVKGDDGAVTHYVGSHTDITERKAAEEKIKNLAFYDPLTHLPNRRLLMDRLQQALASSARSGRNGALLFIDLDEFKTLNDTLGHHIGDLLLQQVAQRLTSCVREGDTVARLGGDEFVVMLEYLSEQPVEAAEQTELIGEKVRAALNRPYLLATHEYRSTPSIGVSLFSNHGQSPEELLKQADIAMYQAKKAGRNTLRFFNPKMQDIINARATLEGELRKALENRQFQLYYQIQVNSSQHPLGAEALIRWLHPDCGLMSPDQFIPLAEETGLILPIGLWVLDTACAQLKAWEQDALTRDLVLAVNVSAKQFHQVDFVAHMKSLVQRHAINPELLKLELTESMLLENIADTIATMNALNEIGIQFSLDDFGTGYSSLTYLKQLPLDQLKIDQSFVRDLATDPNDVAIVHAIITMGRTFGLNVIAEGVETEAQLEFLDKRGCHAFQGYLFGKPVPVMVFEELLKSTNRERGNLKTDNATPDTLAAVDVVGGVGRHRGRRVGHGPAAQV